MSMSLTYILTEVPTAEWTSCHLGHSVCFVESGPWHEICLLLPISITLSLNPFEQQSSGIPKITDILLVALCSELSSSLFGWVDSSITTQLYTYTLPIAPFCFTTVTIAFKTDVNKTTFAFILTILSTLKRTFVIHSRINTHQSRNSRIKYYYLDWNRHYQFNISYIVVLYYFHH